jgi:hypothetical protein
MINQRHCPFCKAAAIEGCSHLALAVEGRDFVRRCIDKCHGESYWQILCQQNRDRQRLAGYASPEPADFTWLETAFCEQFLKHLRWFGAMDYEWRTGPRLEQGGFWVLVWSKAPERLWWELRDELEQKASIAPFIPQQEPAPWLIWLSPK